MKIAKKKKKKMKKTKIQAKMKMKKMKEKLIKNLKRRSEKHSVKLLLTQEISLMMTMMMIP